MWGYTIHLFWCFQPVSTSFCPSPLFCSPSPLGSPAGPSASLQVPNLLLSKIQEHRWPPLHWGLQLVPFEGDSCGRRRRDFCLHQLDRDAKHCLAFMLGTSNLLFLHPAGRAVTDISETWETPPRPSLCPDATFNRKPFSLETLRGKKVTRLRCGLNAKIRVL